MQESKSSAVPFVIALAVVVGGSYAFWRATSTPDFGSASEVDVAQPAEPPITSFELTDQSGQKFDSRSMQGEVWLASYFFSSCPSSCYRLNQALAGLQVDPRFEGAKFVSITCDPDIDTPQVLTDYAKRFRADHSRWAFCTGPLEYTSKIAKDVFQLGVQKQTHSERAVVVDRKGEVRGRFTVTDEAQLEMLRVLLAQCLAEPRPSADNVAGEGSETQAAADSIAEDSPAQESSAETPAASAESSEPASAESTSAEPAAEAKPASGEESAAP